MDSFGYIGISLFMLPLWLYMYVKAKWLRLRMRNIGIYAGVLSIIVGPIFLLDYWNPPVLFWIDGFYAIEDFMFGSLVMSISIAIYNYIFKVAYVKKYVARKKLAVILSLGVLFLFIFMSIFFDYNSIFVFSYSLLAIAVVMIYLRRDLFFPALFTGMFMMIFMLLVYVVLFNVFLTSYWQLYWKLVDTPYEYYLFNIPWTECLFYFTVGFSISILYDFASGTAKDRNTLVDK